MTQPREVVLTTQCPYVGVTQVVGGRCDGLRGVLVHSPGFPTPLFLSVPAADLFVQALALALSEARASEQPRTEPPYDMPERWMEEPDGPGSGDADGN